MEARKGPKMLFPSVSLPGKQSKSSLLISTDLYRSYVWSWRRPTPDGRAHTRVDTTWWPENSTVSAALNLLSCFLCAGPTCRAAMEALHYGEWLRRSSPPQHPHWGGPTTTNRQISNAGVQILGGPCIISGTLGKLLHLSLASSSHL